MITLNWFFSLLIYPEFDFPAKDHTELGERLGIIDFRYLPRLQLLYYIFCFTVEPLMYFSSAAMATGPSFYYLKGGAAALEVALVQYAMQKAIARVNRNAKDYVFHAMMVVFFTGVCSCHYSRHCSD